MTDRIIFELADGWALGFDPNQWIVLRRRNLRTQSGWKPVSFIASKKCILLRVLREKHIQPSPQAIEYLDAMPDTFQEWLLWQETSESDLEKA
jgi:hypothetical protein|tara:strand:- start:473 stop:751 length:279 start_codon:yes stop_codon:yes gene_type:complete